MTVLRHYRMQAAAGRGDELKAVLTDLAGLVAPLAGCEKVELFADPADPATFIFVEHWASVDDHKAAGAALGKEAFAPVMAVLAGPPEGRYLDPVLVLPAPR
ncbi:putative quinol monooxygenase [Rhizorhabdus dicambivorans]|uniref:Antibiotic biosynthesis monooxygenase n=1 Tax=Rhizorhabdus dicambivorans TaxID=1850238 RepID=A0A2A4FYB3_9SPHN|nr:antibiotic biosynthesis monooxygenase [Rhizorhabdus dicambivorans]ATE67042.1 antibiotic biosynthesis monooxygenase [Rhizorhabdus dicambivorans]PCE43208.1 antibiotic biosynthesis monooxygenase [Rhizorhabdus dicambivorans]